MRDEEIVDLFWRRDEAAITETRVKYGAYCRALAGNILRSDADAEECVSDAYLRAWNAIPPEKPAHLRAFLAKITRNLAFDRVKADSREKRGGGEIALVLDELGEVAGDTDAESAVLAEELGAAVGRFVSGLPERERDLFARRYFFAEGVADIARRYGMTANHVSVALGRARKKLRTYLEQEGYLP